MEVIKVRKVIMPAVVSRALADSRLCIGLFTLLPVGAATSAAPADVAAAADTVTADDAAPDFAAAQWAAPVAGAVVGCLAGGVFVLANYAGLSDFACAAVTLSAALLMTGALHEDGLADVADGFGGGRSIARKLAIMKDSRIGTYGGLALIASFVLRVAAIASLAASVAPVTVVLALIAAHGASRALLPLFMRLVPPARADGLAAGIGAVPDGAVAIALCLGVLALLPCGIWAAFVMIVLLGLLVALMRVLACAQINGQTGDVLGTVQQGGEIIILLAASALLS